MSSLCSPGDAVPVMTNGFITARRTTLYSGAVRNETAMTKISLGQEGSYAHGAHGVANSITFSTIDARTIPLTGTINFTDDGGVSGNYSSSQIKNITFDAGVGNKIMIKVNSFYFEFGSNVMYDHLGIEFSPDGTSFDKLNDTVAPTVANWLYHTSTTAWKTANVTWDDDFFGGYQNNTKGNGGGWLFGEQSTDINPDDQGNRYPDGALNTWHIIDAKAIRFHFRSDSSTNRSGWDIDIAQATPSTTPIDGVIGQRLYLDTDGYDKVKDSGNVSLGFIGAINSANNAIYMRSLDFSVYDGSKGEKGDTGAQGPQGPQGRPRNCRGMLAFMCMLLG